MEDEIRTEYSENTENKQYETEEKNHEVESSSEKDESTDIFQWANLTDGIKGELDVEFFLFNKNFAPFTTSFAGELNSQIKPLFLYDMINFVNMGAGTGLSVRNYETDGGASKDVLLKTELKKVQHADALLNVIETQYSDIPEFNENEHDFKRIKRILASFTNSKG